MQDNKPTFFKHGMQRIHLLRKMDVIVTSHILTIITGNTNQEIKI